MASSFDTKFHLKVLTDFVFNFRCSEFHRDSEICDQTWVLYTSATQMISFLASISFTKNSLFSLFISISQKFSTKQNGVREAPTKNAVYLVIAQI